MSDKPVVRDYDHQVAPGVAAHTHEELKTGKHSYEHKPETGFEGPNVVGSAYEKTKVTLGEDKSATSGSAASSGHHHHSSHHAHAGESHAGTAASSTTATSTGTTSTELDKQKHSSSSAVAASTKPIERDYDYQPAPGVQAHTHEVIKQGTNTYEHKAETTFEGPNTVGSAYEKTTVKMSGPKQT